MNSYKITARIIGALFIFATESFIIGNGILESLFSRQDYLEDIYFNKNLFNMT
jgi:hypothetical protein